MYWAKGQFILSTVMYTGVSVYAYPHGPEMRMRPERVQLWSVKCTVGSRIKCKEKITILSYRVS